MNSNNSYNIYKIQHRLILLLFVSAVLIFLDLSIFSVSFIFGSFLILYSIGKTPWLLKPKGVMWYLLAFLFFALISMLLSEYSITSKELKIYIQTIYWFLLAVIVYSTYPTINKKKLSKYILFSTLVLLLLFVAGFRKSMPQNAVAFSVIICAPLGYFYFRKLWHKLTFAIFLILLMLLNGSRSGAIIIFIQAGLMVFLSIPLLINYFKSSLIIFFLLISLFNIEPVRVALGNTIAPYNQRLGLLLTNPDFVMQNDMSWLQRKAQVQKGKQIFEKYPVWGIGYLNFTRSNISIDQTKIKTERSLRNIDNRSAHNTYVALISETGIMGFSSFLLFFVTLLVQFWKKIKQLYNTFEGYVLISFIGMLIYFYTISALQGTSSWIMYGLIAGAAININKGVFTISQQK